MPTKKQSGDVLVIRAQMKYHPLSEKAARLKYQALLKFLGRTK